MTASTHFVQKLVYSCKFIARSLFYLIREVFEVGFVNSHGSGLWRCLVTFCRSRDTHGRTFPGVSVKDRLAPRLSWTRTRISECLSSWYHCFYVAWIMTRTRKGTMDHAQMDARPHPTSETQWSQCGYFKVLSCAVIYVNVKSYSWNVIRSVLSRCWKTTLKLYLCYRLASMTWHPETTLLNSLRDSQSVLNLPLTVHVPILFNLTVLGCPCRCFVDIIRSTEYSHGTTGRINDLVSSS